MIPNDVFSNGIFTYITKYNRKISEINSILINKNTQESKQENNNLKMNKKNFFEIYLQIKNPRLRGTTQRIK
jgi:hypothetical protein